MSKKFWYTFLAVLMTASLVLAACQAQPTTAPTQAPGAQEPSGQDEPGGEVTEPAGEEPTAPAGEGASYDDVDPTGQTVIFWHQHTHSREDALNEIVQEFNETNEWGITVVAEYQGSYGDIFNKMLGVLNTPDAPNLVVAYQNQAATYQLADALVDMNPMVNSEKWGLSEEEQADFFPGFWEQDIFPTYGNARLGFPPNRSMEMLYYNLDWLKELGFDGPPETPEEFKEMACAATEQPFSRATAQGSIGYELSIDASRFASWTFAFGGDVFDYHNSEFTYNSEAAVAAMEFLQDLFESGCARLVTEAYGDQTNFGAGVTLFTVGSSSGLPFYAEAVNSGAQFEWSVGAIPHTTPDPVMNIYGASVSIPKTTPEQELAAWLFVKFYTSPEIQARWAMASEYFPVRQSVAAGLADYFEQSPAYKAAFDLLEYGIFEPPVPGYDFVRNIVDEAMAAIADGADVAKTLDDLDAEADEILDEQMDSPLPTPVPTEPPEEEAAETEDIGNLGTEENPIIWAFVPSGEMERVAAGAQAVADLIFEETGLVIETFVATEYAGVIEALCSEPAQAHIASLNTFGYITAADRGCVEADLVATRLGAPTYVGQIFAGADTGIESLADLEGKTFCAVDELSTSGWIIPSITLRAAGIDPDTDLDVIFAGSHDAAVSGVYSGQCDAGSSYVDARTRIEGDYPDVMEKVIVIETSIQIPNDGVQYQVNLPQALRDQITAALLKIAETPEGQEALNTAYQWEGLEDIDDSFYDPFRQVLDAAGVSAADF